MNLEFRTWDGKKFFHTNGLPYLDGAYNALVFDVEEMFVGSSNNIIQQWTSSTDKNKAKIFEGDIVLFDNPDPYDGQDQLTKIVGYNSRVMGFRLYNFTHEVDKYGGQVFFPEEVEVIGNIFEGAIKDGVNYGKYLKEKTKC